MASTGEPELPRRSQDHKAERGGELRVEGGAARAVRGTTEVETVLRSLVAK